MTLVDDAPPRDERAGRRRTATLVALVAASVLLVASVALAAFGVLGRAPWSTATASGGTAWNGSATRGGIMGGQSSGEMWGGSRGGMMSGRVWLAGDGQAVTSIARARARAAQAAAPQGLHPGEVMQFTDNFYVELKDSSGAATTEVLVDPATGAVATEPGPAMMWNTGSRAGTLTEEQATQAASDWLASNRPGETVESIDAYPGYYTVDTTANGTVAGMLSVNATTGAVWYHTWHGTFVAMEDA